MKIMNLKFKQAALLVAVMLTASMGSLYAQETPSALPEVFSDGDNAKSVRTENTHMTLDKNFVETPVTGVATFMVDEFFNVHDHTGPGMGNYKP